MVHKHPALLGALATIGIMVFCSTVAAQPSFEDQVMELVNQERWSNGQLAPLKRNALLESAAETHSNNMAVREFFAHCDPDNGDTPVDRIEAAGYTGWNAIAENIAAGYATPAAVMAGWMASSGHRANILSTNTRELGIGYVSQSGDLGNVRQDANGDCTPDDFNNGPYTRYWTQDFGKINTIYPVVVEREAYETTDPAVSLYLYGSGWALEMRLRNEQGVWSAWQPFATNVNWTLSAGNGSKTVNAELRNGATVRSASDSIVLNANVTGVPDLAAQASVPELGPGFPNPFVTSTRLSYRLLEPSGVRLTIHDTSGRRVTELVSGVQPAGEHAVTWDGTDGSGAKLPPGLYFVHFEAAEHVLTGKIVLVR